MPGGRSIWRYAEHYAPTIPSALRLSLGEGGTPAVEVPRLAAALGLQRLVLKREDLNPTGSHKDRGAAFQVAAARAADPDLRWLTISSSGNAAIAAAAYARLAGLNLAALVAPETPAGKLRPLARLGAHVFTTPRAITLAEALAEARGIPNLRPSTDRNAVEGYQSIGWELAETLAADPLEALFVFASSATALVGIGRAFARAAEVTDRPWSPALHVVQGTGAHPVAGRFDRREVPDTRGRVGALGARKTRRLGEAVRLVRATDGSGWVVTDAEAEAAAGQLLACGIDTALEGAAALAAASRAAREDGLREAVLVLTGRHRVAEAGPPPTVTPVADLDALCAAVDAADARGP